MRIERFRDPRIVPILVAQTYLEVYICACYTSYRIYERFKLSKLELCNDVVQIKNSSILISRNEIVVSVNIAVVTVTVIFGEQLRHNTGNKDYAIRFE